MSSWLHVDGDERERHLRARGCTSIDAVHHRRQLAGGLPAPPTFCACSTGDGGGGGGTLVGGGSARSREIARCNADDAGGTAADMGPADGGARQRPSCDGRHPCRSTAPPARWEVIFSTAPAGGGGSDGDTFGGGGTFVQHDTLDLDGGGAHAGCALRPSAPPEALFHAPPIPRSPMAPGRAAELGRQRCPGFSSGGRSGGGGFRHSGRIFDDDSYHTTSWAADDFGCSARSARRRHLRRHAAAGAGHGRGAGPQAGARVIPRAAATKNFERAADVPRERLVEQAAAAAPPAEAAAMAAWLATRLTNGMGELTGSIPTTLKTLTIISAMAEKSSVFRAAALESTAAVGAAQTFNAILYEDKPAELVRSSAEKLTALLNKEGRRRCCRWGAGCSPAARREAAEAAKMAEVQRGARRPSLRMRRRGAAARRRRRGRRKPRRRTARCSAPSTRRAASFSHRAPGTRAEGSQGLQRRR